MSAEANKALIDSCMDIINRKDIAAIDKIYAPGYVRHDPNSPWVVNREDYKEDVHILTTVFPDLHFTVEDLVAEENKVVCRFSISGTHKTPWRGLPPTHKNVQVTGICISRIVDGQVVEDWFNTDIFGIAQQLGLIPATSTRNTTPDPSLASKTHS